jgi:iron-sulfur cluster repair protein YtfE (RIC family)
MNSFSQLLEIHKQLDELFLEHQRSLLRLDLMAASDALEAYTIELFAHMQDEEEWMIPMYRERAEIFLGEHDKMRQYLLLFKEELTKMAEVEDLERAVIFLLDSQHIFKRLLVHHDTREKKMLYPLLDQVTTEQERESLFALLKLPPVITVAAST